MRRASQRLLAIVRDLTGAALCALAAHAAAYHAFQPAGHAHAYFGWYERLVGVVSLGSLVFVGVFAAVAFVRRPALPTRVLPPLSGGSGFRRRLAVLATGSLAFLFVQESLERSLNAGDLRLPAFSISAWILVMLALAFAALLVALTQHSCSALLALARGRARVRRPSWRPLNRPKGVEPPRRRHPLADQRGLRAPPLPAR